MPMAVASEDPSDPAVNLQPLTSESHVNSTSSASEGRDEGTEIVEEQPLTVSIRDIEPDAHINGKIAQPVQRPRTRKYMETAALYSGYFSRGLTYGVMGPSILDLQLAVHTNTRSITRIFIGRSVGRVAGVFLSAVIVDKFEYYMPYGISSFLMLALLALMPWTWHVVIMAIALALSSVANGSVDAIANMCILMVWDRENGPWMQALHLCFALGALTGPLVVKPFLKEMPNEKLLDNEGRVGDGSNVTLRTTTVATLDDLCVTKNCSESLQYPDLGTDVWIPFLLLGVLGLIILCFVTLLYCTRSPEWCNKTKRTDKLQGLQVSQKKVLKNLLIFSVFMFYICHCTAQFGFQSYIFAFAVDHHNWHKKDAAVLTSVTFACLMLGRVVGILIIRYIRPSYILIFDCIGLFVANVPLAFFAHSHGAVIWVSSALNGWFVSRLYATGITWLDTYIRVSGFVATVFMVAGGSGDLVGPVVLTALYGNYGLGAFPPLMLTSSTFVLLMCLVMLFLAYKLGPHCRTTSSEIPDETPGSANNL